jgi:hypothetical protein
LLPQFDERGVLSDFHDGMRFIIVIGNGFCFLGDLSISLLSNSDENIIIKEHFLSNVIPNFVYQLIIR